MKSTRQLTAEALMRVEKDKSWSSFALDSVIIKNDLAPRDGAFVSALFYGVLERLITLDACITAHSKQKVAKLTAPVRAILRMTVYQLLYMDSVPDYAAVSEGVNLARKMRAAKAAGYINAVLRSFLAGGKKIPLPAAEAVRLSVEYSVTEPLVSLWLESYGAENTLAILKASIGSPPVFIRTNTLKTTSAELLNILTENGIEAVIDDILPDCISVSSSSALGRLPDYTKGMYHIQDKSSQLCCMALDVQPEQNILDTCAAPGGKSFTIAQLMNGKGKLVSAELHSKRAENMAKRAENMQIENITVLQADMSVPHPELGEFDRILCDVPCSGYGVIRRKPEIRYKKPEDFSEITETQYKILSSAAKNCAKGGRILYSTCTLNPVENSGVISRFLAENPDFSPAPLPELFGGKTEYTILGEFGGDCFFMAALTRSI